MQPLAVDPTRPDAPAGPGAAAPVRAEPAAADGAGDVRTGSVLGYIAGLDGIRALSVLGVLLYHAGLDWARGGYLGVEVFFVISGFLITSLLLVERRGSGKVDLRHFWLRRARRLLPAMFATVLATLTVTSLFLRDELASLRGDAVSALVYVTNWHFILGNKSYFETTGRPSLLTHLWSLAVEEQFYLLWPLLFAGGMRVLGRRRFPVAVAVGALASATAMGVLYATSIVADPQSDAARNRVYLGTDTRAFGLLIGCLLAFAWAPGRIRRDRAGQHAGTLLDGAAVLALGGILLMLARVREFSPALYPFGFVLLDLLTAVLIAAVVHPSARIGRALGVRPLRWIGVRSYGIYLWHWPVFQLTRPDVDVPLGDGPALVAIRFALSFALAAASYRWLELPIRQGALGRSWRALRTAAGPERDALQRRWQAGIAALTVVVLGVTLMAWRAEAPGTELATAGAPSGANGANGATTDPRAIDPRLFSQITEDPNAVADPFANRSTTTAGSDTTVAGGADGTTPGSDPGTSTPAVTDTAAPAPSVWSLPHLAPPLPGHKVALLGDSVLLGASPSVKQLLGPDAVVSATVGRQVADGVAILRTWAQAGWLADAEIVIHLGNNGTFFDWQFDQIMEILKDTPRVVFLTVRVPRSWQDSVNETIKKGCERYPKNTVCVDWFFYSAPHPDWFYDDGMHLRPNGAPQYALLLQSAL